MRNATVLAAVAAAILGTAGCLQKTTTHTLYLSPDGAVTWTALEGDVRSDESNPPARLAEESTFLASVAAGTHAVRLGLAALDPLSERTLVVRAERPFAVVTEAQFERVDLLLARMQSALRAPGTVRLTTSGGTTTLTMSLDVEAARADDAERQTPVLDLLEDAGRYRVVLTEGRFVAATGFRLAGDGTAAVLQAPSEEEIAAGKGVVTRSLTWSRG